MREPAAIGLKSTSHSLNLRELLDALHPRRLRQLRLDGMEPAVLARLRGDGVDVRDVDASGAYRVPPHMADAVRRAAVEAQALNAFRGQLRFLESLRLPPSVLAELRANAGEIDADGGWIVPDDVAAAMRLVLKDDTSAPPSGPGQPGGGPTKPKEKAMLEGKTKAQLIAMIGEMERTHEREADSRASAHASEARGLREMIKQLQDEAVVRDETVAALKRELATLTVEKARLEGYITRANEDDPQPPRPVARRYGTDTWATAEERVFSWWNR